MNRVALIKGPVCAGLFAVAWIGLIESRIILRDPAATTMALIRANDRLVQNHVRAWGEAPESLNELRLFARQTASRYGAFDVWGERIEYLRLGKINYTIRSFGSDGVQNKPGSAADPGVFRWGPMITHGLKYDDQAGGQLARPSVVLFAGADDSAGKWHAKLFVDPVTGVRRLLARSRETDNFFMLAPHDGVEEFLWVPGQEKIVFTASQSVRYSDGVYVWDLKSDDSYNLFALDDDNSDIDPGSKQRGLYVALSSASRSIPTRVSVFAASSNAALLDPREFFHSLNLHVFELGEKVKHLRPAADASRQGTLHDMVFLGTSTVAAGGEGSALQKAWLRLPMGGDWEKGVLKWQDFASQHGKTQLAPYAVWGLAMFYGEAARAAGIGTKDGQIFTSYSVELGNALSNMAVAPGYVRAVGAFMGVKP